MLIDRMIRAARLDVNLYEEVEADTTLTSQAATVVVIVAICAGVSHAISVMMGREGNVATAIGALIGGVIAALIGWVVWSYLTYWIGTSMFAGTATPGEMLRTIGFAHTPGVLQIAGFIPCLGGLALLVAGIWSLIAGVIAIRQALDFDTGKAIITALIGWTVMMIITIGVAVVFGVGAALSGALR